jgi:hypothetical protein
MEGELQPSPIRHRCELAPGAAYGGFYAGGGSGGDTPRARILRRGGRGVSPRQPPSEAARFRRRRTPLVHSLSEPVSAAEGAAFLCARLPASATESYAFFALASLARSAARFRRRRTPLVHSLRSCLAHFRSRRTQLLLCMLASLAPHLQARPVGLAPYAVRSNSPDAMKQGGVKTHVMLSSSLKGE